METPLAKHILIAPLDWGLGHTTRCIPIIRYLLQQGHKVTVAGNEIQQQLLQDACPNISLTYLEGYSVGYSKNKNGFMWSLLGQLPRLMRTVRREHDWLRDFARANTIDGIISDNRYGLWHPELPSVILTHQLQVKTGLGNFADNRARMLHYKFLGRFDMCWVVDQQDAPGLAGSLSHPKKELTGTQYIGWLSQLTMKPQPAGDRMLVLLSGPEPQRTILSNLLWEQVLDYQGKVIFVEGAPQVREAATVPGHIAYYGRLGVAALQPLLAGAGMVVCRSGYTSLMDLVLLNKKAILIPTPGQTEQEYLAENLQKGGFFLSEKQEGFDLKKALYRANSFPYRNFAAQGLHEVFKPVLNKWLGGL